MSGYIEVITGRSGGTTYPLPVGKALTVGSSFYSDVYLPDDPSLFPIHFTLANDKGTLRVVAVGPTFAGENEVGKAVLPEREWLVAGNSVFLVTRRASAFGAAESPLELLAEQLSAYGEDLFVAIDAAVAPEAQELLEACAERFPLFTKDEEFGSPWIALVTGQRQLILELLRNYWGHGRLVFFSSTFSVESIRDYFRDLLLQPLGEGVARLRWFDPRVLRLMLRRASRAQAEALFGPVECYYLEDRQPSSMLECQLGEAGAVMSPRPIVPPTLPLPAHWEVEALLRTQPEIVEAVRVLAAHHCPGVEAQPGFAERVGENLRRAAALGWRDGAAAVQYVLVALRLGDEFAEEPDFVALRDRPELTPAECMDLLVTALNQAIAPEGA